MFSPAGPSNFTPPTYYPVNEPVTSVDGAVTFAGVENRLLRQPRPVSVIESSDERLAATPKVARRGENVDQAAQRVLDLADRGLDRSFRLAGLILGDRVEAEDATQDALINAWRSSSSLRDPAGFDAWFDRILVNVCRDRLRRRGRIRVLTLEGAADIPATDDPFRSIYASDDLLRGMSSVSDDVRIVLILHFWADLTLAAVGTRLGWPIGTVKSRLARALARLRERLADVAPMSAGGER